MTHGDVVAFSGALATGDPVPGPMITGMASALKSRDAITSAALHADSAIGTRHISNLMSSISNLNGDNTFDTLSWLVLLHTVTGDLPAAVQVAKRASAMPHGLSELPDLILLSDAHGVPADKLVPLVRNVVTMIRDEQAEEWNTVTNILLAYGAA